MPNELRVTHSSLAPHIENLIERNRSTLIKAAVPDQEVQEKLLQINQLISEVKAKDPGTVAAWGLGCGGSCAVDPETLGNTIFRR